MKPEEVLRNFLEDLKEVKDSDSLERIRIKYVGKKGIIQKFFSMLKEINEEEKRSFGKQVNDLKNEIEKRIEELKEKVCEKKIQKVDKSISGIKRKKGTIHPLSIIENRIVEIFMGMGFSPVYGYEIETDYYNFTALNTPEYHPARDLQDTFYLQDGKLLRTHTSPVQIRTMEKKKPPIRIISPGRAYRVDAFDASHSPVFHQIEGLYIDKDVNMGDLFGTLEQFMKEFFGPETNARFSPSYFPFTEPSAEMSATCPFCKGSGCNVCKYTGWVELGGCGMVHRKILDNMGLGEYRGFAFGLGVDRLTMLYFDIDDIRLFFENDLEFLEQF